MIRVLRPLVIEPLVHLGLFGDVSIHALAVPLLPSGLKGGVVQATCHHLHQLGHLTHPIRPQKFLLVHRIPP